MITKEDLIKMGFKEYQYSINTYSYTKYLPNTDEAITFNTKDLNKGLSFDMFWNKIDEIMESYAEDQVSQSEMGDNI